MGVDNSQSSDLVLMVTWEPEIPSVVDTIKAEFPSLRIASFCLQTASRFLLEESQHAPPGTRPGRYIFNELLMSARDFDVETRQAQQLLKQLLREATVYASLSLLPPQASQMPNVRLIHVLSAGVDMVTENPLYRDESVTFTNSKGIHGVPLAEWVLMSVLSFQKRRLLAYHLQQKHEWPRDKSPWADSQDLNGSKVGILGYGSIGRQVARLFSAFGCSVIAYTASRRPDAQSRLDQGYVIPGTGDPSGSIPEAWFGGTDKASLHEFLAQGLDFLVLSVALTPLTTHLMSREEFEVLSRHPGKKGPCFLINIARGKIVDQVALVSALNDGQTLTGAALDVTSPEPLPPDSSLWKAQNVMITPHIGSLGRSLFPRAFDVLIANLRRRARGEKLLNVVDKDKGY